MGNRGSAGRVRKPFLAGRADTHTGQHLIQIHTRDIKSEGDAKVLVRLREEAVFQEVEGQKATW